MRYYMFEINSSNVAQAKLITFALSDNSSIWLVALMLCLPSFEQSPSWPDVGNRGCVYTLFRATYGTVYFNPYSAGINFSRQDLTSTTSKVDPRTVKVNICIMVVDP